MKSIKKCTFLTFLITITHTWRRRAMIVRVIVLKITIFFCFYLINHTHEINKNIRKIIDLKGKKEEKKRTKKLLLIGHWFFCSHVRVETYFVFFNFFSSFFDIVVVVGERAVENFDWVKKKDFTLTHKCVKINFYDINSLKIAATVVVCAKGRRKLKMSLTLSAYYYLLLWTSLHSHLVVTVTMERWSQLIY